MIPDASKAFKEVNDRSQPGVLRNYSASHLGEAAEGGVSIGPLDNGV